MDWALLLSLICAGLASRVLGRRQRPSRPISDAYTIQRRICREFRARTRTQYTIRNTLCTIAASASLFSPLYSTLPASTCRQRIFSLPAHVPRRCYRRSAQSTTDPEALPAQPWRGCTGYPIAMFRTCGPAMPAQPRLYRSSQPAIDFFSVSAVLPRAPASGRRKKRKTSLGSNACSMQSAA